jgi:hypothetical protein
MYIIYKKIEDSWVEIETSTQPLDKVLIYIFELGKENTQETYRLEEVNDLGKRIINFS